MPRLPRHLRGPALVLACAAAACLACAAAAWAQDPAVLAPALPTTAAPSSDPFAGIAAAWGSSGVSLIAVGTIWREWRKDIAEREKRFDDLAKTVGSLEMQLALTRQALAHVRDTLRAAADD